MKKIIKNKIVIVIFLLITFFLTIILLNHSFSQNKENSIKTNKFNPYVFFNQLDESYINKVFSNRVSYVNKEENCILIGNNIKELNNGYFDIKFVINNSSVNIYINKLIETRVISEHISEEYLNKLYTFLESILDINLSLEIKEAIIEEYLKIRRDNKYVEDVISVKVINIDNYKFIFNVENNMIRLEIRF